MTMEQNAQPIRVAQMMTDMNYGGVEMVVMNYYRHMDRSRVQFDFFALEGSTLPQREEIERLGGRVYVAATAGGVGCQNQPPCRSMNGRSGGCSVRTDTRSFTPT